MLIATTLRLGIQGELDVLGRRAPSDRDHGHTEVDRLRGQQRRVASARRERDHPKLVGLFADDVERLARRSRWSWRMTTVRCVIAYCPTRSSPVRTITRS